MEAPENRAGFYCADHQCIFTKACPFCPPGYHGQPKDEDDD